jgi:iron complex outermembrane receptor protein
MEQQNVQSLDQTLSYTAGVGVQTYGMENRFDWFNIRGFDQSTYGLFRDDSRWQSGQVEGQIDPYELQEVDVIKGPSSVLYGQTAPGGLVNLVTKRPDSLESDELILNLGSYARRQVQGDIGGALGDGGRWRYRLTGLLRESDTQVNDVPDNRRLLAPGLTWAASDRTTLTLLADYQYDNTGWSQFLPADGTLTANPYGRIATGFFTGQPGFDFFHRQQWSAGYLFEHRFAIPWTIRQTSRFSRIAFDGDTAFGGGLEPDQRTLDRFGFSNDLGLGLYTLDTQALTHFKLGPTEHSILIGVDYSHADADIVSGSSSAPSIDVFAPAYSSVIPAPVPYSSTHQPSDQTGLYLQDQIKIARKIVVTLSIREDWTHLTTRQLIGTSSTTVQNPSAFTGRAGLAYVSESGLTPYVSYSTSFLPLQGVNYYGVPFQPITGKQIESGVKYQPKHSSAFITASYFNIDEHNVETPDPANPLNQLQTGGVRSRGVEVEGVASLFHGFDVHASYSYLDEVVTQTTDVTQLGKRPTLIPDRLASAIANYTVSRTKLSGLGLGFGIRNVGTTAGDPQNTLVLPGYTLFDASIRYDWRKLRFQVNATNVADKIYVPMCTSESYCNYGYRRDVIGSIRFRWNTWRELL